MNKLSFSIRPARQQDLDRIVEFNCAIARETEDKQLDSSIVSRGVRRGLEQGNEVRYFVAVLDDDQPIGQLMLTREWSDWRNGWLVWIQSVYVQADCRGNGVFRSLFEHVMVEMRQDPDIVGVRLYVESENTRAQTVYLRSGFVDPRYKVLEQML